LSGRLPNNLREEFHGCRVARVPEGRERPDADHRCRLGSKATGVVESIRQALHGSWVLEMAETLNRGQAAQGLVLRKSCRGQDFEDGFLFFLCAAVLFRLMEGT